MGNRFADAFSNLNSTVQDVANNNSEETIEKEEQISPTRNDGEIVELPINKPVEKPKTVVTAPNSAKKAPEKKKPNKLLGVDFKLDTSVPIKSKGVDVTLDNAEFLETRSIELGMNIQNYFNLLILEAITGIANDTYVINREWAKANHTGKSDTKRYTFRMTEDTAMKVKRCAAKSGMRETYFLNYIVYAEQQREIEEGARKGIYD